MRQSQTDIGDDDDPTKTPRSKAKSQITSTSYRQGNGNQEEDVDSNVQEGERSTIASLPPNGVSTFLAINLHPSQRLASVNQGLRMGPALSTNPTGLLGETLVLFHPIVLTERSLPFSQFQ